MRLLMEDFVNDLEKYKFDKQLEKLVKKYKNKKVVIYAAGKFFTALKTHYDLSKLNIIAVSDRKFYNQNPEYSEEVGYNIIAPEYIYTLHPDIVLITAVEDFYVERYFHEKLFKNTGKKFKYKKIFNEPFSVKLQKSWNYF